MASFAVWFQSYCQGAAHRFVELRELARCRLKQFQLVHELLCADCRW